ncbi:hypothetical protein ABK040_005564 [Willaertia magna]
MQKPHFSLNQTTTILLFFFLTLLTTIVLTLKTTTNNLNNNLNNNLKKFRNILITAIPSPGHVRPIIELIDQLLYNNNLQNNLYNNEEIIYNNITFITHPSILSLDSRLQQWLSPKQQLEFYNITTTTTDNIYNNNTTVDNKNIHIQFVKSHKNFKNFIENLIKEAESIEDPIDAILHIEKNYMIPFERKVLQMLEFQLQNGDDSLQKLSQKLSKKINIPLYNRDAKFLEKKRQLKLKEKFGGTVFDMIVADFSMLGVLSVPAEFHIPCAKIYLSALLHNPFHYPGFTIQTLQEMTNYFKRLQLPYFVFKELSKFILTFDQLLGANQNVADNTLQQTSQQNLQQNLQQKSQQEEIYFTMNGLNLSEENCARIQTTSLGFEYSSASTAKLNTFLVGPFLNLTSIEEEKILLKNKFNNILQWMDNQENVILTILGTTMVLKEQTLIYLLKGFVNITTSNLQNNLQQKTHNNLQNNLQQNSVLIALRDTNMELFNKIKNKYDWIQKDILQNQNIKIVEGFVPQKALLSHKNVKIFISHCGANSLNEALYFGKLIIGIPFSFDQFKMATNLQEFKVGIPLYTKFKDRENGWNENTVVNAINKLLQHNNKEGDIEEENEYVKNVEKIKILMKFAGGVKRAAEVIEMVSDLKGDLSWTKIDNHLSFIQYYCLDIILTYLFILILIIYLIVKLLRCMLNLKRIVKQRERNQMTSTTTTTIEQQEKKNN